MIINDFNIQQYKNNSLNMSLDHIKSFPSHTLPMSIDAPNQPTVHFALIQSLRGFQGIPDVFYIGLLQYLKSLTRPCIGK